MNSLGKEPSPTTTADSRQYIGRQIMFGFLHLALVAPSIYLVLGLPLVLREHGWSGTEIGLFQLAGLPAVFKFILAAPVERMRCATGHYKTWAIGISFAYIALLFAIGQQDLEAGGVRLFLMALGAGLMATWADIPVNALAIKILPPSERMRAGGVRSAAIFLGAIIGGGLMLLVYDRWGWQVPFLVMTVPILIGTGLLASFKEPETENLTTPINGFSNGVALMTGFFKLSGANAWTLLLVCYFPLVGAAWIYLKPLLLDYGFSASQVAWVAGVLGSAVGALASIGAAKLVKAIGIANALALFAGLNILALGGLALLAWIDAGRTAFVIGALILACSMGATSALAFGLMMNFTRASHHAADYGTQASLFTLSRVLILPFAGVMLDHFGYAGMLSGLTVTMIGVLMLVLRQGQHIERTVRDSRTSDAIRPPKAIVVT